MARCLMCLAALALSTACGPSSGEELEYRGVVSCTARLDASQLPGLPGGATAPGVCLEVSHANYITAARSCGGEGPETGMLVRVPCSREGATGGCAQDIGEATATSWYYGASTSAVQWLCAASRQRYVAP